tara:strand:+ start:1001 stop:1285 length:285 start_codon:yes stop_codon:yes gene_type:complete
MSRFKPQVTYVTKDSLREYHNAGYWVKPRPSMYVVKQYPTYAALKKDLKEICESNIDDDGAHVVRSRRGHWGEWNETWKLDNNRNPTIVSETWS